MILSPACAICAAPSALVEVLAPGELPDGYDDWPESDRQFHDRYQDVTSWRFRYAGPGGGNGWGDATPSERAACLIEVFTPTIKFDRLDEVDLYDDAGICRPCRQPYCYLHWNVSATGYGRCPNGHGKSLDPFWSPD